MDAEPRTMVAAATVPSSELLPSSKLAITDNPFLGYLATLSPGSIDTQRCGLRVMLRETVGWAGDPEDYPWHELRSLHTAAIRTWLAGRYAPSTANRILCALRGVLYQCNRLDLLSDRDYRRAIDLKPIPGARLPAGRHVARGELRALFAAAAATPIGARDAAILATLYGAGVRNAEACALDLADLDREARSFKVEGKGNKHRRVYFPRGTLAAIDAYLVHRGSAEGPLFWVSRTRKCHLVPERISSGVVRGALRRLARGGTVAHTTPHDLRRTFVGDLLDAGADISSVSTLAGHASVTTTQRYDRRGERAIAAAAELLSVPFGA